MPLTRQQRKDAYEHVIKEVFDLKDSPLDKSLRALGIDNILDLMSIRTEQIEGLTTKEGENDVPVPLAQRNILRAFSMYVSLLSRKGTPIGDDWVSINADNFNEFRISDEFLTVNRRGRTSS